MRLEAGSKSKTHRLVMQSRGPPGIPSEARWSPPSPQPMPERNSSRSTNVRGSWVVTPEIDAGDHAPQVGHAPAAGQAHLGALVGADHAVVHVAAGVHLGTPEGEGVVAGALGVGPEVERRVGEHRGAAPELVGEGGGADGLGVGVDGDGTGRPHQVGSVGAPRQAVAADRDERHGPVERPGVVAHRPGERHHHQLVEGAVVAGDRRRSGAHEPTSALVPATVRGRTITVSFDVPLTLPPRRRHQWPAPRWRPGSPPRSRARQRDARRSPRSPPASRMPPGSPRRSHVIVAVVGEARGRDTRRAAPRRRRRP